MFSDNIETLTFVDEINDEVYPSGPMRKKPFVEIEKTYEGYTDFELAAFKKSYYFGSEEYPQEVYNRVASYLGTDSGHAERLYSYMKKKWFTPATPLTSNAGTNRGKVISCNVNEMNDNKKSIINKLDESFWLATGGAGLGMYMGNIRSIGEATKAGPSGGLFPFLRMVEAVICGSNQGGLRRANCAVYLPVWHPEIEDFVRMRLAHSSNEQRRRMPDLHHAVLIPDAFMEAVRHNSDWELKSPKTGETLKVIRARELWQLILETRMVKGEPYIVYIDTVNRGRPEVYKKNDLFVTTSQLCAEIVLKTGTDYNNRERTAVCCLSSLNLEKWDEWKDDPLFIQDVMEFLDNGLTEYIDTAGEGYEDAAYAAYMERSVGLGVMGFHTFLQKKRIPFESALAKSYNMTIFKKIREKVDAADIRLADLRGACPDALRAGIHARFSHKMAIAPTASISTITGGVSPGIEPIAANIYGAKTLAGNFAKRNQCLTDYLKEIGKDTDEVWSSISVNSGSVQHLDFMDQNMKDVFKTAEEIDQRWVIEHAADRQPHIDQAQSVNLFLDPEVNKKYLHRLHFEAWEKGCKSLYYCRSDSVAKPDIEGVAVKKSNKFENYQYEECLACQ